MSVYLVRTQGGFGLAQGPIDPDSYVAGPYTSCDDAEQEAGRRILRERMRLQLLVEGVGALLIGAAALALWVTA